LANPRKQQRRVRFLDTGRDHQRGSGTLGLTA
jgi:hypothetical protein